MSDSGFYSLKTELPGGKEYSFSELKGKVVLIVNVASKWYVYHQHAIGFFELTTPFSGFTPQYKGLQNLYLKYKDQNFVILGFPCNQVSLNQLSYLLNDVIA